uniref:DUF7041 domain-containing protein n=1 Tax=Trichuris muris TaxID=70415 RepID=A0A5S6R5W2_TRIMR
MSKKGNCSVQPSAPASELSLIQPPADMPQSVTVFLNADHELWFARLYFFFRHTHVDDEETRFELALSAMPEDTVGFLLDFLLVVDQETAPWIDLLGLSPCGFGKS